MEFPGDIIIKIIKDFSIPDLLNCSLVCRKWNRHIKKNPQIFWGKYAEAANFNQLKNVTKKKQLEVLELFKDFRMNIRTHNDNYLLPFLRFYGY